MTTTIQISEELHTALGKRKLYDRETYEEVIWDLIEDTRELSEETKKAIKEARSEYERGEVKTKGLESHDQERIVAALKRIRIRPGAHVKKLVGEKAYRLRVGGYRMIMDIFEDKLIILVLTVGHRKNVYK
jgi:mRNA interferase RelE/StbE